MPTQRGTLANKQKSGSKPFFCFISRKKKMNKNDVNFACKVSELAFFERGFGFFAKKIEKRKRRKRKQRNKKFV